ncbi:MAG: polyphosphate kinase [Rhodospirillaceae bacterium]|nr:polyphosphate kinase [Rhodospirillaceae bacterium]
MSKRPAQSTKRSAQSTKRAQAPRNLTRAGFDKLAGPLRTQLLGLQDRLKSQDFSVILVFVGSALAGKNESLNLITEWLDPRWIITHAYGPPSSEEAQRPEYWRYWRDLPPKGRIGLFAGSWYHNPVHDFAGGEIGKRKFKRALDDVRAFEKTLAADGTLILKFWLHMDKAALKKRMKALEADKASSWRIGAQDWAHLKQHRTLQKAHELAADHTDMPEARWIRVDGADPRRRALEILTTIRGALTDHMARRGARRARVSKAAAAASQARRSELAKIEAVLPALEKQVRGAAPQTTHSRKAKAEETSILDRLDLSSHLETEVYEQRLKKRRAGLGKLFRRLHFEGRSAIILFEGPDAAGKGGAIRRLTASMDARDFQVIQIAAPTEEERAQHYLWRFWKHLPQAGRLTIYDRSWYGRVLVERVERFAQEDEWSRAYGEINDFERRLRAKGIVVVKFWIHISKDEQLRRFKERETISYKKWKLTPEDWRNREKWNDYAMAVDEMVARTSTELAPWTVVEGNDKKFARIKVMDTVYEALRTAME